MFTSNDNKYNAIQSSKKPQVTEIITKKFSDFEKKLKSPDDHGDLGKWMKSEGFSPAKAPDVAKWLEYKKSVPKPAKKKAKYQKPRPDQYLDEKFWKGRLWTNYLEAKARTNHHQRFGVEYEIKEIHISYGDKKEGDKFHNWARNCAHLLPIYTGKKDKELAGKVEIHLDSSADSGDKHGGVLLEVVTGQLELGEMATVMEWFRNSLVAIKTSKDYLAWLEHYFEPQKADINLHDYIKRNLTLTNAGKKWHSNPQVTTTLTAKELLSLKSMPAFTPTGTGKYGLPEQYMSLYVKEQPNKSKNKNYGDEFIIQKYLGSMRMYREQGTEIGYKVDPSSTKGKGGRALIKHAAQQFESYSSNEDSINNDPIVDRLDLYLETDYELLKLRTRANKIAPIFKRPDGAIAYVIEYRGGCDPESRLGEWFEQGVKAKPLTEEMLRDIFFKNIIPKHKKNIIPKHKKAANTEDIEDIEKKEDPLELDDYAKIRKALEKQSK